MGIIPHLLHLQVQRVAAAVIHEAETAADTARVVDLEFLNMAGETVENIWARPNIHISTVRGLSGSKPGAGSSSV